MVAIMRGTGKTWKMLESAALEAASGANVTVLVSSKSDLGHMASLLYHLVWESDVLDARIGEPVSLHKISGELFSFSPGGGTITFWPAGGKRRVGGMNLPTSSPEAIFWDHFALETRITDLLEADLIHTHRDLMQALSLDQDAYDAGIGLSDEVWTKAAPKGV